MKTKQNPAVLNTHPLYLHRLNNWFELFPVVRPYRQGERLRWREWHYLNCRTNQGHRSFLVTLSPAVEEVMKNRTCPELSVYFQLVEHDDGRSLVIMQYDQIIGSHWLTRIDNSTAPSWIWDGHKMS
jgi:hypothetical protein